MCSFWFPAGSTVAETPAPWVLSDWTLWPCCGLSLHALGCSQCLSWLKLPCVRLSVDTRFISVQVYRMHPAA